MSAGSEITRRAKSNLAFALRILPKERRDDMETFYAFCRTMDDLADDPRAPVDQRAEALDAWKHGLTDGFPDADELQAAVTSLRDRHSIPTEHLTAIIDGCRMDLMQRQPATWEELAEYIWKVACAVGLVSIRLFGCKEPESETYAVALGRALQLTNILRDIREDLENGRIYLPEDEMARFGYTADDLRARVRDDRFLKLMEFEAARAESYFQEAERVMPAADHAALLPARIMAEIYHLLLGQMRGDGFRVMEKRYSVSHMRKLAILSKHLVAG